MEFWVPKTGFEPARRFQRYHLKVVRLPISPPGHLFILFSIVFRGRTANVENYFLKRQASFEEQSGK
jgi:hypothetical protein